MPQGGRVICLQVDDDDNIASDVTVVLLCFVTFPCVSTSIESTRKTFGSCEE